MDDTFTGYAEELNRYAGNAHDLNPNRTRDNLDMIRFSLRSLEQYAPWVSKVTIVSARPQVPRWLDTSHKDMTLVHHDAFIPETRLPTFNSFAILSQLHLLDDKPRRFLYFEDDMLLTSPTSPEHFIGPENKIRIYPSGEPTPSADYIHRSSSSPWNKALVFTNETLDQAFGSVKRPYVNHVPMVIDVREFARIWARWPKLMAQTAASKFRAGNNIAMEHLYPYYLLENQNGFLEAVQTARQNCKYLGLENIPFWNSSVLWWLSRNPGKILTLNDNFGTSPQRNVVKSVEKWLWRRYPVPSRFELL